MGLKLKIWLLLFMASLLPTALLCGGSYFTAKSSFDQELVRDGQSRLALVEGRVVGKLSDLEQNTLAWAKSDLVARHDLESASNSKQSDSKLLSFFVANARTHEMVRHLTLFSKKAQVLT